MSVTLQTHIDVCAERDVYAQMCKELATRVRAAEFLLLEADACIDILLGASGNERGRDVLAAIERHWQTYPEPLEETSDV